MRSVPNPLSPNLVLSAPSPSTTTQTLFGAAPSIETGILHELLAVQIATILLGKDGTNPEREMERNRPVLVGIGLKKMKKESGNVGEGVEDGEGEDGIGEGERRLFAGVMGMVLECTSA